MNETYFERFDLDEEGGVSAPLAELFSGIFAERAAFGGPVVTGATTSAESTGSSRGTASAGQKDAGSNGVGKTKMAPISRSHLCCIHLRRSTRTMVRIKQLWSG